MARVTIEAIGKDIGDRTILDDVTLDVLNGEFFCVIGPSGCEMVHVRRDGFHCIAEVGYDVPVYRDEWVGVGFGREHAMLFDAETGRTIN